MKVILSADILAVLHEFEKSEKPFSELDVDAALTQARRKNTEPTPEENHGAWAEILAFNLQPEASKGNNPWDSYWAPMGSKVFEDGRVTYFPDIKDADSDIIEHWKAQTKKLSHPILKARYADLVWELETKITTIKRRDKAFAEAAIDSYLQILEKELGEDEYASLRYAKRAADLAATTNDQPRLKDAKRGLFSLHNKCMKAEGGPKFWWQTFDFLIGHKKIDLSEDESQQLIADAEYVLKLRSNASQDSFDPHDAAMATERLARAYAQQKKKNEIERVHGIMGKTYELHAGLGDALLASFVLKDSQASYKKANMHEDAERIHVLLEQKTRESQGFMQTFGVQMKVEKEVIEKFVQEFFSAENTDILKRIAVRFLLREERLLENRDNRGAFIGDIISKSIIADNHVAATVGSAEDDPVGYLIMDASRYLSIDSFWLLHIFDELKRRQEISADFILDYVSKSGLFLPSRHKLILEGLKAWFADDHVKAIHVLIPQIEAALRLIIESQGKPVTKPRRGSSTGTMQSINMGDMLSNDDLTKVIGKDFRLHLLTLYADARGWNLRNEIAHGLMDENGFNLKTSGWVLHTLLLLGLMKPKKV